MVASTLLLLVSIVSLSSFIIPTLKPCSVLSDPLVQAKDSWTLGRVDHLLPSRGGQGKGKWEFAPNASRVFLLICHNTAANQFGINELGRN